VNYQETLDFLYTKLPAYQQVGKEAFKKDLHNIRLLLAALGNPHNHVRFIHVAGTNGKGSVSHMLTSMLMEAGVDVGTYTSPHYQDFRERIRINGQMITKDYVIDFVDGISQNIEKIKPSFFEITVAMAFHAFNNAGMQWAVVETGLGGRLDSTNIITPELSVITNIGMDHMDMLGNTLVDIAGEKAGIIKPEVPVVIGNAGKDDVKDVFIRRAELCKSKLFFAQEISASNQGETNAQVFVIDGHAVSTGLVGAYQLENCRTTYACYLQLKDELKLSIDHYINGLTNINHNTEMLGRFQILQKKPLTILDSAHNQSGLSALFEQVNQFNGQLHVVFGCVSDKDMASILPVFPMTAKYYLCPPTVQRAMDIEQLTSYFNDFDVIESDSKFENIWESVQAHVEDDDIILVCGSIFLIADCLNFVEKSLKA